MTRARLALVLGAAMLLAGCPAAAPTTGGGGATTRPPSTGGTRLAFWHTRRGSQEQVLRSICEAFGRANPGVTVELTYQGGYRDLNTKIRASIAAKSLPALAVAYEDNVSEYMANGVVRPLDDLVADRQIGLKPEELADIPPQYLAANRYPHFRNQLLSFPFTKSNLLLYCNRTLLKKGGFDKPPETWDDFEQQARTITKTIGAPALAFDVDASSLDGFIYSFGGRPVSEDYRSTLFDKQPTVRMLSLLQRMAKAKTLTEVAGDDVPGVFAAQRCAFGFGTSAGRANLETQVGSKFEWDVAVLPHAPGVDPVTVMYGPNVCIFRSDAGREREAWKFVKYFVSPEVTARLARETGYLPVRASATRLPEMLSFYQQNPRAKRIYEILAFARPEPNVLGWQEVRGLLEAAARKVITTGTAPEVAAVELKRKADKALAESRVSN